MSRIKTIDTWTEPAYCQVMSDEGPYEAHMGYNVMAKIVHGKNSFYLIYRGTPDGSLPMVLGETVAERLVSRIKERGTIDPTYWTFVANSDSEALPDYVLNPHRPEYN